LPQPGHDDATFTIFKSYHLLLTSNHSKVEAISLRALPRHIKRTCRLIFTLSL